MPIVRHTLEAPTTLKPNISKIAEPESKSIVVDTKYTPLSSLITFVTGSSWTVDYFSQLLDKDNDLRGQDVGQSSVYQQYTRIKGMELKVTSSLSQNQNNEDKRMVVSGSSTVYPFIIPNEGDMFAADVGDGKEGIFRIKNTEKKSFLKESTYVIEYEFVYYSQEEKSRRDDLDTKSIRTLYYVKDFLLHGQNPLLVEEDFYAIEQLQSKFQEISRNYLNWFYNAEYSTLIVPGQSFAVYDHYLTQAVLAVISTRDAPQIKYIRRLNIDGDKYLKQPQLWSALVERDKSLLGLANTVMGLTNVKLFANNPMLEGICYSGIKYIVYPSVPDITLNNTNDVAPKPVIDTNLVSVTSRHTNLSNLVIEPVITKLTPPIINRVNNNDGYVLSKAFYESTNTRSVLEIMVDDYINNKAISPTSLLRLTNDYKNWGGLERFYYCVIVLILIKSIIKNI